jgi:potassium efflux system protein
VKRTLLAAAMAGLLFQSAPAQTTNAAPLTNAPPAAPAVPASNAIKEAEIFTRASALLDKYPAPTTPAPADPAELAVRDAMKTIESELPLFTNDSQLMLAQNATVENITTMEKWGNYFATVIGTKAGMTDGWVQTVSRRLLDLKEQLGDIDQQRTAWDETAAALKKDPTGGPAYAQQIAAVQARLAAVRNDTVTRQRRLLQLQVEIDADGKPVTNTLNALEAARTRAISRLFEANAPPVWASEPLPAGDTATITWSKQLAALKSYLDGNPARFLGHLLLLVVLIGTFWWLRGYARRLAQEEPGIARAAGIFETPFSTALLFSIGASPLLYYPIAPRMLYALLGAAALIPCVVLLRRLIEPRLFPIFYALAVFFFLEEIRSVASMPVAGARAFLLAEILGAVAFLGWLLLRFPRAGPTERFGRVVQVGAWIAFALLAVGWLADVLGYVLLANLLCISVQRAATLALALYAGIRIVEALLFIALRLRPLSGLGVVKGHGSELLRAAQRLLAGAAVIIWCLAVLDESPWAADVKGAIFNFLAYHDVDKNHLQLYLPGKFLVAALIIWGVFQVSRLSRFILAADFYPRLRLAAGIPYAISTSLHYALLVVAFVAACAVLGIDMTKFTILVSAFGVGIGFGLQNIINNFVSGLILLFERPVKIGDTILTGTDTGTVERIGIRASVLRTAAGTEVIVPNGTLISSNVTNWTLSSRERIILIPLNVPRGPDLAHLIEILTSTAAAQPLILKNPPPQVIAQILGPNLGLELRAWTGSGADWTQARSGLVLAVEAALAREKIALA